MARCGIREVKIWSHKYRDVTVFTITTTTTTTTSTISTTGARGDVVVKALRYKPAGHGFDS
jgi:hypothetical protein